MNTDHQLILNLKQFGLNPNEWALKNDTKHLPQIYKIQAKKDPELCLIGRSKNVNGKVTWDYLQLLTQF